MTKRILISTDFSENSVNAIRYVLALYGGMACDFHVLHAYYLAGDSKENLLIPEPSKAAHEAVRVSSEKDIEKLKETIMDFSEKSDHKFHFSSERGPLLDVIREKVKKEDIDLIVMGTRGQNDMENLTFGSVAISVMENVRVCPVLAIPRNTPFKKPNEIVLPTGFKTNYKIDELKFLAEISRLTEAPIRILYIKKEEALSKAQVEKKKYLEDAFSEVAFSHHTLYDVAVKTGVRCFVQSRESGMIAFVNKKHFFFGGAFSDPMVKQLGRFANVPLLALHNMKKKN
ncbi:MAG TPA: universal stress protein [Leeuwenhoekiella sp.]|nr:universal stress protein [Leeuwenhoekiella sp.]